MMALYAKYFSFCAAFPFIILCVFLHINRETFADGRNVETSSPRHTYWNCGLTLRLLRDLRLAVDVDGDGLLQGALFQLHVVQEADDAPRLNQELQLVPASIKELLLEGSRRAEAFEATTPQPVPAANPLRPHPPVCMYNV